MLNGKRWTVAAAAILACTVGARGEYDVRVDLKNVSGQTKTDWPVILRVYTVLGRNLPQGSVNPDGYHVYDPAGAEVPHAIERIPPYDQPGNDEIVFVIPKMAPRQTLSYRITNTKGKSAARRRIHVAASAHNLIADGNFEAAANSFAGAAKIDTTTKHQGKASLALTADNQTVSARYAKPIALNKGSWYYFGAWSKTDNVSRFGYQAGSAAHFKLTGFAPAKPERGKFYPAGAVTPQCSTRDWVKATMEYNCQTPWGMDIYAAKAVADQCTVEFALQQRRHFYMAKGKTRGRWWLDDVVLMEQPEVNVRFDLAVKADMKDGVFAFTRPPSMPLGRLDEKKRGRPEWCAMPHAHERLASLNKSALKGQRVSFCIGVYHTRQVNQATCRVAGGALTLAATGTPATASARLPVELIEYCPGYLGDGAGRYMKVLNTGGDASAVTLAGQAGVRYFFLTFNVPKNARAGKYVGRAELVLDDKTRSVPVTLRVQDMVQPTPADVFVGLIYQGSNPRFDDEGMTVYSRSGFNCVTRFGNFFDYEKDAKGNWQIDLAKLGRKMMWLKGYGLTGVCVFSDFDLGPKWDGGTLLKRTRPDDFSKAGAWGKRLATAEQAYKAQIQRIEAARKAHPEWPALLYMTWDEPNLGGGRNGRPDPAMGWVNQVAPDALTTLDVQFDPLGPCLKWYAVPAFDDPANWAGPEIYRWVKAQGKQFGYCGGADKDEAARYQPGMLMIASGAKFFHAWHLTGGHIAGQVTYDKQTRKLLRAPAMVNWGDGMNDLKAYHLLQAALDKARGSNDAARKAALTEAQAYLKRVVTVFNGDHKDRWSLQPYLGNVSTWGYEQFYDDWQERMTRHAAAVSGVQWVE